MDRDPKMSNVFLRTLIVRAAFILGGSALAISTSEIVHDIYLNDPYFAGNGLLQLLWFVIMFVSFVLVAYGLIMKNKPLFS